MPGSGSPGSWVPGDEAGRRGGKPWAKPVNRQKAELERNVTAALGGIALIVASVIWVDPGLRKSFPILSMAAIGSFAVLLGTAYIRYVLARINYEANQGESLREAAREEIDKLSSDPESVDILRITQLQMEQYHQIAKTQAQNADRNSQIAMTLGLLILASGAVAFIVLRDSTSKFALIGVGVISVIGAAFTAFITKTFISVRESASKQFEEAVKQPTIIRLNLLAELLAGKLAPKLRDRVRVEIIRNLLQQAGYLALALPAVPPTDHSLRIRNATIAGSQDEGDVITSWLNQVLAPEDLRETLATRIRQGVPGPRSRIDRELAADSGSQKRETGNAEDLDAND